ncbi:beta-ketoacyl synthase N-terminal-like domain-containing protein, partial [Acinetobacter baumannii]|uniref:beta-ketoacyl synthase N-terminal-like domain-containing protein n=1 Tax=Acinetobacter baumannii TaxID=470 RepID=UPI000A664A38
VGSTTSVVEITEYLETKGASKVGPFFGPRNMTNTITANVGVAFKLQCIAHSIASACSTSADAIGYAYNLIALGKRGLMLAGGCEEDHWSQSLLFDAMGSLFSKYNDTPETASRPYSKYRNGFVIAGGVGFVVLESLEHAQARGANILSLIH